MFPPDMSVRGATVDAAHPAPLPEEPTVAQNTTFRTSAKQHTPADHVAEFLSRVSRALRNLADSADHAAKMVRKADAARRS